MLAPCIGISTFNQLPVTRIVIKVELHDHLLTRVEPHNLAPANGNLTEDLQFKLAIPSLRLGQLIDVPSKVRSSVRPHVIRSVPSQRLP